MQTVTSVTDRGIAAGTRGSQKPRDRTTDRVATGPGFDAAELDDFVREHHDRLVRLARLVCRDTTEAADAVQAGLEQAWRHRDSLADSAKLRPWLDRIVVREAIRLDRRRDGWLARFFGSPRELMVDPIDPRSGLAHELTALRVAFESLSAEQRAAIALHLHLGYSVAETAEIVDAPHETVRSRLRLGRQRLRESLRERSS